MNYFAFLGFLISLLLSIAIVPVSSIAQERQDAYERNLLKFNALPLVIGKFAIEYERLVMERISVGAEVSFRPTGRLPFRSTIDIRVNNDDLIEIIRNFKSANFTIAPEVRFYFSKHEALTGFYIAPYLRYSNYSATAPYDFDVSLESDGAVIFERSEVIPLSGRITSFVGGVSVGANFKLTEKWYLDWRIIGPGYGGASGSLSGNVQLEDWEQRILRERLVEIQQDLRDFTIPIRIEPEVSNDGAEIRMQRSPWPAVRAGLSIAYRF